MRVLSSVKGFILVLLAALFFVYSPSANALDLCEGINRETKTCYRMKIMRSLVLTLDAERELVQGNFPLFMHVGVEIESIATELLVGSYFNMHLEAMNELRSIAGELKQKAAVFSHDTFQVANQVRQQCQQCHSETNPRSGYSWDKIFPINWDKIPTYCNSDGRNPYICRHMHAMGSLFDYFYTAVDAGKYNFDLAMEHALEIQRIATLLLQFPEPFHEGGRAPLDDIIRKSTEVVDLAMQRDVMAFEKGESMNRACLQCHNVQ